MRAENRAHFSSSRSGDAASCHAEIGGWLRRDWPVNLYLVCSPTNKCSKRDACAICRQVGIAPEPSCESIRNSAVAMAICCSVNTSGLAFEIHLSSWWNQAKLVGSSIADHKSMRDSSRAFFVDIFCFMVPHE
ncbi:MAG: hypothetical protein ACYC5H_05175 [Methylovirgula sp.]